MAILERAVEKPRLLVFELHHLGDAVMALPFVNAAAEKFKVAVCCRPAATKIFALAQRPPILIPWEPAWEKHDGTQLPESLRDWRADAAVCAWPDTRVHLLMRRCGIARRIGFPAIPQNFIGLNRPWRRRRRWQGRALEIFLRMLALPPLTESLTRPDSFQHHTENWRQLGKALGVELNLAAPWLRTAPQSPERGSLPRWVVHPGGRLATKRWPWARMREVIAKHLEGKAEVVLVQPPDWEGSPAPGNVVEPSSLAELAGLIESADAVLCNDSLAAHLAAALGKPTVTIFGSGEPRWFAPVGANHEIVRRDACPLHPCIDRCEMPSVVCLEAVTVADVGGAVDRLLGRLAGS